MKITDIKYFTIRLIPVILLSSLLFFISKHLAFLLSMALMFGVITAAYSLSSIRTGYINLGFTFIMGTAGYLFALFSSNLVEALFLSITGGILGGLLIGMPTIKLRGPYYAVVSLVYPFLLITLSRSAYEIFKGDDGIPLWSLTFQINSYYIAISAILSIFAMLLIASRRFGLILSSISMDEILTESNGLNVKNLKISAYTLAGFFVGVATFFMASLQGIMSTALIEPIPLLIYILLAAGIKPGDVTVAFLAGTGLYVFDSFLRGLAYEARLAIVATLLLVVYFIYSIRYAPRE